VEPTPLVVADDLRLDVEGVPACDGLALRTTGERVLILGAPRALFEALTGLRSVARGALRLRGAAAGTAARDGLVAGAPLDPPLPPKWTALEYATWSARLAGFDAADARALAKEALARVQLEALATTRLALLPPHARRALVVAAALATEAPVVVLEDPLANLPEELARTWARTLVQALGAGAHGPARSWVVLAPRVALTSELAMSADEALVVTSARVEAQGPPAAIGRAEHRYVARIHGPVEALDAKLAERGASLEIQGAQVLLDLGEALTTAELLGLCAEASVTIVELTPAAAAARALR
jgi:ABC-2 type transport system ATP-binding protein